MRKKKREESGGSWMDTYGDMVTLLLCFFVMLYAISAVDQTKWANLVKSLNPDAVKQIEEEIEDPSDSKQQVTKVPKDFETLYENLKKEVEEKDLATEIEVKKGEGFTFISFKDNVFFDGYSYALKDRGKQILDDFAKVIKPYNKQVKAVEVLGHTADVPHQKSTMNDRFLSSNRATAVVVYLQEKNVIDPSKMISMGYGHFWPIATNDTVEGRAKNRRVEVLITKTDSQDRNLKEFYDEIYQGKD